MVLFQIWILSGYGISHGHRGCVVLHKTLIRLWNNNLLLYVTTCSHDYNSVLKQPTDLSLIQACCLIIRVEKYIPDHTEK